MIGISLCLALPSGIFLHSSTTLKRSPIFRGFTMFHPSSNPDNCQGRSVNKNWRVTIPFCMMYWLVVWNMNLIFPNGWDDDPIWRIFFRGVGIPPTSICNYICMLYVSCFETETGGEQPAIGCYRYIMVPDLLMGIQLEFVKWWLGMVSWGMSVYPILIHIWYISWYIDIIRYINAYPIKSSSNHQISPKRYEHKSIIDEESFGCENIDHLLIHQVSLVGGDWNMNCIFQYIENGKIIPTDEFIFFRGVVLPPTSYYYPSLTI